MNQMDEQVNPLLSQEGRAREARWGGSQAAAVRHENHPSRDREAIPLPS